MHRRQRFDWGRCTGSQTKRAKNISSHPETLGSRAVIRLVRKMPPSVEKLRAFLAIILGHGRAGIYCPDFEKILNRFLSRKFNCTGRKNDVVLFGRVGKQPFLPP